MTTPALMTNKGCSVRECGRTVLALGVCAQHYYGAPEKRSTCSAECDRQVHRRGLCTSHYRLWRLAVAAPCSIEGCERPSADSGMCGLHVQRVRKSGRAGEATSRLRSTDGVCGEDGCELKIFTRGLCRGHYLAHGLPCSIDGCEKPVVARKLCGMHYARLAKTGDPGDARPRRTRQRDRTQPEAQHLCSVEGCGRAVWSRELCGMHYQRRRAYGDPTRVPPRWERRPCAVEGCQERARDLGRCPRHAAQLRRERLRERAARTPSPEAVMALAEAAEAARRWREVSAEVAACRRDRNDLVRTFALIAGENASARLAAASGLRQGTLRQIIARRASEPEPVGQPTEPERLGRPGRAAEPGRLAEWRPLLTDLTAAGAAIARADRERAELIVACWESGATNAAALRRASGLPKAEVERIILAARRNGYQRHPGRGRHAPPSPLVEALERSVAEIAELTQLRQGVNLRLLQGIGRLSEILTHTADAEMAARGKRDQLIAECWRAGTQNLSLIERRTGLSQATVYKALRDHGINPPDVRR
ncbi:hypothetical protein Aph01nite_48240 [Acrocarpospora phusangensis]|uniref:Uncharacterized protein n=1 Tax=Acrocarpospora phusangensis TaxID=1070424 RepID=A0A919QEW6_9ACTN|nr:hypothetical protein [Acrocarpospora phusangensis]GIH26514.1 hypothetical protein Aph01nite_48240 [Acrocarpospora phusangensis]